MHFSDAVLAAPLLLGLMLCMAPRAQAFEIARDSHGQPLSGLVQPAEVRSDISDDVITAENQGPLTARAALWQAVVDWQQPASALLLLPQQAGASAAAQHGQIDVYAIQQDWPAEYGSALATIAFTVVEIDESLHKISRAQIYLNAQGFDFSTTDTPRRMDLQGSLAHELGHALGLEHNCGEPFGAFPNCDEVPAESWQMISEATMFPRASAGNIWQRIPADDDVNGLLALYPCAGDCSAGDASVYDASVPDASRLDAGIVDGLVAVLDACDNPDAIADADAIRPAHQDAGVQVQTAPRSSCSEFLFARGPFFAWPWLVVLAWRRRRLAAKKENHDA